MENNILAFTNQDFGTIRTIEENNKVLFCGNDIAKSLGYEKPNNAISKHCRCTLKRGIPHPQSQNKTINMVFISESDLYRLIANSKLPSAEKFETWIFDEVLPQIRATGGFVQSDREEEFIENYFPSFTDETKLTMIKDLRTQNIKYKEEIATLKPQAEAYRDLMTAEGYLPMLDIAGMVEIGRTTLFKFLRDCKVLTKQSTFNIPAIIHTKNGKFKVITTKDEKGHFTPIVMVSPKGLNYIYKLLKKKDMLSEFNSDLLLSLAKRVA